MFFMTIFVDKLDPTILEPLAGEKENSAGTSLPITQSEETVGRLANYLW